MRQSFQVNNPNITATPWRAILIGMLFVGLLVSVPQANAQAGTGVIRVDPGDPDSADTSDCGSESKPCQTIQQAVDIATSGDAIRLAGGTYTGTGAEVVNIGIGKNVTIVGGYSSSNWNTSDPVSNQTIIDGQNTRRGFRLLGSAVAGIQGVTIQNGYITGGGNTVVGGGLYCVSGPTITLTDVIIKNNVVQGSPGNMNTVTGGGAAFYRCTLNMTNVTFDNNQATGADASPRGAQARGGGFFVTDKTVINGNNVTVTNNTATAGDSTGSGQTGDGEVAQSFGGGFDIGSDCTATFTNIDVQNNISRAGDGATYGGFGSGGGVFIEGSAGKISNVTITGGKISNNQAIGGDGNGVKNGAGGATGGALMAGGSGSAGPNITLNQLEIIVNTAQGGLAANASGGAFYFQAAGAFTGNNLIIADNTITAGSGGIGTGGVIEVGSNVARTLTLNYSTIANNNVTSPAVGQVISIWGSATTFKFNDSIIANHLDKPAAAFLGGSGHSMVVNRSLWYNNNATKFSGSGGTVVENSPVTPNDPAFVSVAGNNFRILATSAAIDASSTATVSLDIDGDPRPRGSAYDVGADEYLPALALSTKTAFPTILEAPDGPAHPVTYTIQLTNSSAGNISTTMVDPFLSVSSPISANLSSGPTCTGGTCNFSGGNINWNGTVNANNQVTIEYTVEISFPTTYTDTVRVTNSATLTYTDNGGPQNETLTASTIINPMKVFLPVVHK